MDADKRVAADKSRDATASAFLTALKALPKAERDAVVVRIAQDKAFVRDILDMALVTERRDEPSRPFRDYVSGSTEQSVTASQAGDLRKVP